MYNYENELDAIRIKLYEETINLEKDEIVRMINTHAQKIAQEFGIRIVHETRENDVQAMAL